MEKRNILSQYDEMRKEINESKDQYLETLFKNIRSYFENPEDTRDKEEFIADLEDIIYDSLTKTYAITAKAVEKIYDITFTEKIDDDTLRKLTYSADGKTLNDRLNIHYDNAINRDGSPTIYLRNRIALIMDTETLYSSNHVIHGKLKRKAKYVEVININEDCCEEHPECEYWLKQGKIPIEELAELPPYHPDCECEVIYYFE